MDQPVKFRKPEDLFDAVGVGEHVTLECDRCGTHFQAVYAFDYFAFPVTGDYVVSCETADYDALCAACGRWHNKRHADCNSWDLE